MSDLSTDIFTPTFNGFRDGVDGKMLSEPSTKLKEIL
jgi:hypothetical protein